MRTRALLLTTFAQEKGKEKKDKGKSKKKAFDDDKSVCLRFLSVCSTCVAGEGEGKRKREGEET